MSRILGAFAAYTPGIRYYSDNMMAQYLERDYICEIFDL